MNREKFYPKRGLEQHGWRMLIAKAGEIFGESQYIIASVSNPNDKWGYDKIEDFLSDVVPGKGSFMARYISGESVNIGDKYELTWSIASAPKSKILEFEHFAEDVIREHSIATEVDVLKSETVIFIGHGGAGDWRLLKDHLTEKHGIKVEAYETGSRAGHSIRDVLEDMLEVSSLAILVHTPEDELASGMHISRPNVIHETGLFQGRLGFSKAVVLLKDGTQEFSNLSGVQQIRFKEMRECFGDVLAWIKREEGA